MNQQDLKSLIELLARIDRATKCWNLVAEYTGTCTWTTHSQAKAMRDEMAEAANYLFELIVQS